MNTVLFFLFLSSCLVSFCRAAELEPDFSYEGDTGPAFWGSLTNAYNTCTVGHAQSPVNINASLDTTSSLTISYQNVLLPVKLYLNHKSAFTYNLGGNDLNNGSFVTWNSKKYNLIQFHFHAPSEHHVHSHSYSLEVHFVHRIDVATTTDPSLLVIGVLFNVRKRNKFVQRSVAPMLTVPATATSVDTAKQVFNTQLNISDFMASFDTSQYWSYSGSLTTPPCSEGVQWIVMQSVQGVAVRTLTRLATVQVANNRFTQPKNGRNIKKKK
jgi:carbonic anhydrase